MQKGGILFLMLAMLALILAACGGDSEDTSSSKPAAAKPAAASPAAASAATGSSPPVEAVPAQDGDEDLDMDVGQASPGATPEERAHPRLMDCVVGGDACSRAQ